MVSVEVIDKSSSNGDSCTNKQNENDKNQSCQVCGGPCTTRCSLCKLVYYCSVDCQRMDWGGHKKTCLGRKARQQCQRVPKTRTANSKNKTNATTTMGPSVPPPTSVQSEDDVKRVLQELWTIADSAVAQETEKAGIQEPATAKSAGITKPSSHKTTVSSKDNETETLNPMTLAPKPKASPKSKAPTRGADQQQQLQQQNGENSSSKTSEPVPPPFAEVEQHRCNNHHQHVSFVVEEMPQICCFQLTLRIKRKLSDDKTEPTQKMEFGVSVESLGRSKSRTLVVIGEKESDVNPETAVRTKSTLFAGEFPRPIRACDITSSVVRETDDMGADASTKTVVINVRLPYAQDPSNTSSLALGGSLCSSSSGSESTLEEINAVVCRACHLALILPKLTRTGATESSPPSKQQTISRVFPLPQGHWDEIADYLICYDGQPVVDFSAGSECAEPSIALQDASMLCFHRRDVERAVCALAVDGYGELTEQLEADNQTANSANSGEDLGSFFTKPKMSSFELPSKMESPKASGQSTADEKKDDSGGKGGGATAAAAAATESNEPPISATSAVIRGDRTWQDAVDGESVSLCCARCCSPIGFCSLGSPETWRFWKHRLAILVPKEAPPLSLTGEMVMHAAEKTSFAEESVTAAASTTKTRRPIKTILPVARPLGSCSSFLGRELVRYAESKAIFTFVVRREGCGDPSSNNKCLLLRLLSWETCMATSFEPIAKKDSQNDSHKLLFQKVAKIVFEETIDPTIGRRSPHHNSQQGDGEAAPTQWFWGGVDLCCPPFNNDMKDKSSASTPSDQPPQEDAVSTVRLQLPSDEYDSVLKDLVSNKSLFEPQVAKATILIKMGGLSEGLGLTMVVLE